MHFLSVTSIPEGKNTENSMQIAVRKWIRLIYRPENLIKKGKVKYTFQKKSGEVKLNNLSPFYIFLYRVEINGKKSEGPKFVIPFGNCVIGKCLQKCHISYELLEDYGSKGETENIII